jgi:glycosyltransferase involved in cell wall biosynthesis
MKCGRDQIECGGFQCLVSVIVPTYNRPETLLHALKSVLSQTYQAFEIIVINDAGADVEKIVRSLGNESKIRYLKHNSNKGLAATRNTGIRAARGKYIAYLDDDDIFYENHLEILVDFLENCDLKVAYTDSRRAVHEMKNGKYEVKRRDTTSVEFDYDRILIGNLVPVLSFMHEKACIDDVGSFDEKLTSHEDWDLWIRMSRRFKIAHIKKVTCEFSWRLDGSSMSSSKQSDYLRTLEIIYTKYRGYAEKKPFLLELQRKNLILQRKSIGGAGWVKREKRKMLLARFIGLGGVDFFYRMKLKYFRPKSGR